MWCDCMFLDMKELLDIYFSWNENNSPKKVCYKKEIANKEIGIYAHVLTSQYPNLNVFIMWGL